MTLVVPSSYRLQFTVLPPEEAPELPEMHNARESPIRAALKGLPRGGFLFIRGNDRGTRKRISDICTHIQRRTKFKKFAIRGHIHAGYEGLGVWRVDAVEADKRLAKAIESKEIPHPTKSQLMAGK